MTAGAVAVLRPPPAEAAPASPINPHKRGYIPFVFPFVFESVKNAGNLENPRKK